MQVASDFICLFLGVGVGQWWVKRQETNSGRERGATEPYTWRTKLSNFPATPGPESFRVLNSEVGRWVIWASTLQTCSTSPESTLSLEISSRRLAFCISWHRKKKIDCFYFSYHFFPPHQATVWLEGVKACSVFPGRRCKEGACLCILTLLSAGCHSPTELDRGNPVITEGQVSKANSVS